ncbi:unnamed protein product, partial [marine sediment metagenome]
MAMPPLPVKPDEITEEEEYNVRRYPLDVARPTPGERIELTGDSLTAYTNGTLAGCFIRLNSPHADPIPINEFNPYKYTKGWARFYLETTAQAGRYLRLHIGRAASAEASVQITAVAPTPAFYTIISDKDGHFTDAILTNAKEDENLIGLLSSKIRIVGLAIQSVQQLHYRAIFWRRDTFENADLDIDSFISEQELDLTAIGYQIAGAGQWYGALTSLNIDCEDED